MASTRAKKKVEPTTETSCISDIPQTTDYIQHGVSIMKQPLPQTLRGSNQRGKNTLCKYRNSLKQTVH